jgi:hypothetical protein
MNARWVRVTKKSPCVVCRKPDWCDYSPELGLALCMRVESERPSRNSMGGWLHGIGEPRAYVPPRKAERITPSVDLTSTWRRWFEQTDHYYLDGFAMSLGVDTDALRALGCARGGNAWAFPMTDADKRIVGIRLRDDRGNKWAVRGSRQGLFIPSPEAPERETLFILEGPTDTAAALTLGLHAVGRPSCMGSEAELARYVRRRRIARAVIVADNDAPGLRGAEKLKSQLSLINCTFSPPCKDLREFVRLGGSRQLLESMLKDLTWSSPSSPYVRGEGGVDGAKAAG